MLRPYTRLPWKVTRSSAERSLPPWRHRLNTLATLPAEFVAYMEFRLDWPGPAFHWYLEPLAEGQPNKVTHTLRCSGPARSGITAGI